LHVNSKTYILDNVCQNSYKNTLTFVKVIQDKLWVLFSGRDVESAVPVYCLSYVQTLLDEKVQLKSAKVMTLDVVQAHVR